MSDPRDPSKLPFGINTLVIPFTWNGRLPQRPPRSATGRWGTDPDLFRYGVANTVQTSAGSTDNLPPDRRSYAPIPAQPPSKTRSVPNLTKAMAHRPTDGSVEEHSTPGGDAGRSLLVKASDVSAPIPLVDDQGQPIITPAGRFQGQPMQRPPELPPQMFVAQGARDRKIAEWMLWYGGPQGIVAMQAHQLAALSRFRHGHSWDAQRLGGGRVRQELVDYATVSIGLYAAAAGISRDEILTIQDSYAARNSDFGPEPDSGWDRVYTHLPVRNVRNTDLGFELYRSGRITASSRQ